MNSSHLGSPRARLSPGPLQPAGHRAGKTQGQQDTGPASSRVQRLSSSTPATSAAFTPGYSRSY